MVNLLLIIVPMIFGSARDLNEQGNRLFKKKEYGTALEKYKKAQVKDPSSMIIDYNMGCAKYQVDSLDNALELFTKIISSLESKELKGKAFYNIGNVLLKSGNIEGAIESYKEALKIDPKDIDAKINLEFAEKIKKEQKNQQQNQKGEQQNKDKQKQNQGKQKQDQQGQNKPKEDQQKQEQQKQDQQKESAENFLKSFEQDEKDAKQKSQQKAAVGRVRAEKDW